MKRKEERNQKEREVRQRMNLPSPTKGGFHVGPSQLHLGDFMAMGGKRKREEAPSIYGKVGNSGLMNTESKSYQASTGSQPSRTPLQEASANTMTKIEPRKRIEDSEQSEQDTDDPQKIPTESVPPTHSCNSLQVPITKPSALPRPLTELEPLKVEDDGTKAIEPDKALPMGPPPLPKPLKPESAPPTTHQACSPLAPQGNPPNISLDPWDDFFVSNTQIVREISLTAFPQAPKSGTPTKKPSSPSLPSKNETTSLLSHLSTQDLDTSDVLTQPHVQSPPAPNTTPTPPKAPFDTITTPVSSLLLQISTQDLDFTDLSTPSKSQRKGSSDFNEDVTEEDLEDLVLEYEMQSSWGSKGEEKVAEGDGECECEGEREKTYIDENDAFESELSTQDWRELGVECG